jgi:hypothetical protein
MIAEEGHMQFKPQRTSRAVTIVAALTAALVIFSVWVFFVAGGRFALSMVALTAVVVFFVLMDTARLGWHYTVDEEGILVKRTFKRYRIAGNNISVVQEIGRAKVKKIIRQAREGKTRYGGKAPGVQKNGGTASVGKVNLQVEIGRIIGFSSIPINLSKQNPALSGSGKAGAAAPNGRFVLVVKRDGRQYLLSPRQPEEFVRTCRKHGFGK